MVKHFNKVLVATQQSYKTLAANIDQMHTVVDALCSTIENISDDAQMAQVQVQGKGRQQENEAASKKTAGDSKRKLEQDDYCHNDCHKKVIKKLVQEKVSGKKKVHIYKKAKKYCVEICDSDDEDGRSKFKCTLCGSVLAQKCSLLRHIFSIHKVPKNFTCKVCGDEFSEYRKCEVHISEKHPQYVKSLSS